MATAQALIIVSFVILALSIIALLLLFIKDKNGAIASELSAAKITAVVAIGIVVILLIIAQFNLGSDINAKEKNLVVIATNSNGIVVIDTADTSIANWLILCDSSKLTVGDLVNASGELKMKVDAVAVARSVVTTPTIN